MLGRTVLKRKPPKSFESVRQVRAYLDDVEHLHTEMTDVCERVRIETRDYKAESFDDLRSYPNARIPDLRISGVMPAVSLSFTNYGVLVHRMDDDNAAFGLAERLRQVLVPCRRRPIWLYSVSTIGALAVAQIGLLAASKWVFPHRPWSAVVTGAEWAVTAALVFLGYLSLRRGSVVYPVPRREAPSFFTRNRDALTVNLIVAALTALATYFVTR